MSAESERPEEPAEPTTEPDPPVTAPRLHLAIDPAKSTGWAVFEASVAAGAGTEEDETFRLTDYGFFVVDTSGEHEGVWMLDYVGRLNGLLERHPGVEHIHFEQYFFSGRKCTGSVVNAYYRGALLTLAAERSLPVTSFTVAHWRKFVCGHGARRGAAKKENKTMVIDALRERYGVRFPEKLPFNGKQYKFRDDVSDAVAIGLYGLSCVLPRARFVAPQPDAVAGV